MSNDASKKKCLRCYALGIECSGGEDGYPCWQCRNAPAYGPVDNRAEHKPYFVKEREWVHKPLAVNNNTVKPLVIRNAEGREDTLYTNTWPERVCEIYGNAFSFLFLFNSAFAGRMRLDTFANILLLLELRHGALHAKDPDLSPIGVPVPPDFVPTPKDQTVFQAISRTVGTRAIVTEDVKRKLMYILNVTQHTGVPMDLDVASLPQELKGVPLFAGFGMKGVTNLVDDIIPNTRKPRRKLPYTLVVAADGQQEEWVIGRQSERVTPALIARPVQDDPSRLPRKRQPSPPAQPAPQQPSAPAAWAPDPASLAIHVRPAYNAANPEGSIGTTDHMATVLTDLMRVAIDHE